MKKLSHVTILDQYAVDMGVVLGQGSTGCVYQGLNMKTGDKVAIKMIDLRTIDNQVAEYLLTMEKTALMTVNNPYILKGLKVAQDSRYCFMITEFCNGGTLKKQIKNSPNECLNEEKALKIFYQLLVGYKSLVEKNIVHRDLKPANIMLHNNKPKIIDFGYCEVKGFKKPSLQYNVGSPSYMAPESFQTNVYNEKTQIWALGVILFECLTGKTMDDERHMSQVYYEIEMLGIPYPSHVSSYSRSIINWCLSKNPKNRPTCAQLIESYFTTKQRTKSNFTPIAAYAEYACQGQLKNIQNKQISLKQAQRNKILSSKTEQLVFQGKSKAEAKSKHYKIPDFLQMSKKSKDQNDYLLKSIDNNYQKLHEYRTARPLTKIKTKVQPNEYEIKSREISNKKNNGFYTKLEHGSLAHTRNNSKVFQTKNQLDIDSLYDKLYKPSKVESKNKVLSNNDNFNAYFRNDKAFSIGFFLAKQYQEGRRKLSSQKFNPFRA